MIESFQVTHPLLKEVLVLAENITVSSVLAGASEKLLVVQNTDRLSCKGLNFLRLMRIGNSQAYTCLWSHHVHDR